MKEMNHTQSVKCRQVQRDQNIGELPVLRDLGGPHCTHCGSLHYFLVFRVSGDESIEKQFGTEASAAGLVGTSGHRSVGGMRISLYNAVTLKAVEALTSFMREFQRTRG